MVEFSESSSEEGRDMKLMNKNRSLFSRTVSSFLHVLATPSLKGEFLVAAGEGHYWILIIDIWFRELNS